MKKSLIATIQSGGVAVILTDTIYGIVGQALNKDTVERIIRIKRRQPSKPFIILISDKSELELFGVKLNDFRREVMDRYWPGPVSLIFESKVDDLGYLHRGTNALAFRLPNNGKLLKLLKNTGPLVAPSANPEGERPATNISEAKRYFSSHVDYYDDSGLAEGAPSKIIKLYSDRVEIIR